jgi:iron complex outermembrane recepter protein
MSAKLYLIIICLLSGIIPCSAFTHAGKVSLSGLITERNSGSPLTGVTIYFPELRTGTITDSEGRYTIGNLPPRKLQVQVTFVGYKRIFETVDLAVTREKNFILETAVAELHELVVTGSPGTAERNRVTSPVVAIPSIRFTQSFSDNLVHTLSQLPGVNQVTTGTAISKPVIRGMGFNRVIVIHEGVRQEGQQWGDEHGLEIDELSVSSAEVLKGPASLMYGSDAVAGVINLHRPPTSAVGTVSGKVTGIWQSNNGLMGYGASLSGNQKGIAWNFHIGSKQAHAYKNDYDGYVFNSGYFQQGSGGMIGLNRHWGYSHLHFSAFEMRPGIVEGERDSLTGEFIKPIALSDTTASEVVATNDDFKSYKSFVPYQTIQHYKLGLNNNFILKNSILKVNVAWQQNRRKEFGEILNKDQFGLFFLLNTFNYDFHLVSQPVKDLEVTFGLNGMIQLNENRGAEFLIPDYNLADGGLFAVLRKTSGKFDFSGGLRYDLRHQNGQSLFLNDQGEVVSDNTPGATRQFEEFNRNFSGFSGSAGMAVQLSEIIYTKLNFAAGFRTPNIAELASNGVHEGSGRYEYGNVNLKPERSYQADFGFGINSAHVTGELNLFSSAIDHYIYISKLNSVLGGDSLVDEAPAFNYSSGDARLYGGEVSIDVHPHPYDWLHFENAFSVVYAEQVNKSGDEKYLPFIPAPRFTSELRANSKKLNKYLLNGYFAITCNYFFRQDKIYRVNDTETETPAYNLWDFSAGSDLYFKGREFATIMFQVSNIFDKTYQSHLSRLKYAPENLATGRRGVYNMGRSFHVKFIIPLRFRES